MKLSMGGTTAGLVIRLGSVELLILQGKSVAASLRVSLEGSEPHHLTEAIQRVVASAGLKNNARVAVAVPTQDVLFRFFSIPVVSKPELETVVQFEVRKYIPFKMEQLIWDFHTVASDMPSRMEVIFGAILRERYERVREALAAAGLQPILIEPRSLSLARLVKPPKEHSANDFVCLVEIDEESAHLAIIKQHLPYLTRDINFVPHANPPAAGGSRLPAASEPQPGDADVLPQGIAPSIAGAPDPRLQRLLSELSVSIDFFTREYPSTRVRDIFLIGDDALVGAWCEWLAGRLHCRVESGKPFLEPYVRGTTPLICAAGVGVIQAAKQPRRSVTLNFLKRSMMSKARVLGVPDTSALVTGLRGSLKGVRAGLLVAVIGGVLLSLWAYGAFQVDDQRRQLARLIHTRPDAGWGLNAMTQKELEPLKATAQTRATLLKGIMDGRTRVAAKFDALARALPEGVWLTGLSFEDRIDSGKSQPKLVLNGACFLNDPGQELQAIQTFEQRVKDNAIFFQGFQMAQLDQMSVQANSQQSPAYRTFQLSCNPVKERP